MDALIFPLSTMAVIISLGALLHLQFGRTGIVNFGVVGFSGLGMYLTAILVVNHGFNFGVALVIASIVTGLVAAVLGWFILDLDSEAVLVATLAFATIVYYLVTTESALTGGVVGLGTVPFPFDLGDYDLTQMTYLVVLVLVAAGLLWYAWQVGRTPYGRLMLSIQDNEPLSRSLGKSTFGHKVIFFAVTCAAMGLIGGLEASVNQFLVPRLLTADATFVIWIALILGGRKQVLGIVVGAVLTFGLFDVIVEQYVALPREYAHLLPDMKLMLFGLVLILVIMFRPAGLLGARRRSTGRAPAEVAA
ncbi:hypothetical protein BCA37_22490 [Mycobacterium sp. djl-10]|nr:hypothetical protein BCA37_22490 [Mycobacterium sp. djl-10]